MPRLYTYENVPLLIYPKNGVNNLNDERSFTATNVLYCTEGIQIDRQGPRCFKISQISLPSQLRYDLSCSAGVEAADDGSDC